MLSASTTCDRMLIMTRIQRVVLALKKQHGTWRAAGAATGIDHAYLHRLATGKKTNPDELVLAKLGIEKLVTYRAIADPETKRPAT